MNMTINNKPFRKKEVKKIFKEARKEIREHGVENKLVDLVVREVERGVLMLGGIAEIEKEIKKEENPWKV